MNKVEITNHGKGLTLTMGLASMHVCVLLGFVEGLCAEIDGFNVCLLQRISIRCRIVCCTTNCDSLPKLCRLQRISIRRRNWVVCSEFVIRCRNWVFCSELAFAAETVSAAANWHSLPKLCRLQRIGIRCRNWVVCSEFVIRCRNWVFCSELAFTAELCVMQRNCDSLPKLSCLLRVSICCRNCGANSETVFAAELGSLQRTSSCCRIGQPAVFAAKLVACSETVFDAELGSLHRTSSRCRFLQ